MYEITEGQQREYGGQRRGKEGERWESTECGRSRCQKRGCSSVEKERPREKAPKKQRMFQSVDITPYNMHPGAGWTGASEWDADGVGLVWGRNTVSRDRKK